MIVLITDPRKNDLELAKIAIAACRAIPKGALTILFRDKVRDDFQALEIVQQLRNITTEHGQLFLVSRRHLRLAYEVGTDGVHVNEPKPKGDTYREMATERVIVSMPAHSDADVTHALANKINWVLVSPIFSTPNKGQPRGLSAIRNAAEITANHEWPKVVALGGVDSSNAHSCVEAGADGVAVMRAILDAPDPEAATRALWNAVITSK